MYDEEFEEDDSQTTIPCTECGEEIYDDTVQCPHCGCFVTDDHSTDSNKPSWFRWLGVALIILLILIMAGPIFQFLALLMR